MSDCAFLLVKKYYQSYKIEVNSSIDFNFSAKGTVLFYFLFGQQIFKTLYKSTTHEINIKT
jgi:hypothetical protein